MPHTPIDRAIAEMPARAAALLARLRADDKRRPFGKLDYTQYFPREVETKADGKARFTSEPAHRENFTNHEVFEFSGPGDPNHPEKPTHWAPLLPPPPVSP